MEPGHEDREEASRRFREVFSASPPQWSPVTRTGRVEQQPARDVDPGVAAMEPGHEDREENRLDIIDASGLRAAMEPGHEDREESEKLTLPVGVPLPQWSPVTRTGKRR